MNCHSFHFSLSQNQISSVPRSLILISAWVGGGRFWPRAMHGQQESKAKMRCRQQAGNKTAISRFTVSRSVQQQANTQKARHRSISIKRSIIPQSILNTIAPFYWPKLSAFDRITSSSESSSSFFYRPHRCVRYCAHL